MVESDEERLVSQERDKFRPERSQCDQTEEDKKTEPVVVASEQRLPKELTSKPIKKETFKPTDRSSEVPLKRLKTENYIVEMPEQAAMMTFKSFMSTQDDAINVDDAVKAYERYKVDFKRRQISEFFVHHKNQEWFKLKYHPELFKERLEKCQQSLVKRRSVFEQLDELKFLDKIRLEASFSTAIVQLLDAATILMEGGNTNDLSVLNIEVSSDSKQIEPKNCDANSVIDVSRDPEPTSDHENIESKKDNDENKAIGGLSKMIVESGEKNQVNERPPAPLHKTSSLFLRNVPSFIVKSDIESICSRYPGFLRVALQDPMPKNNFNRNGWVTFRESVNIKDICWNLQSIKVKGVNLSTTVNSELKQRIRFISGISAHNIIVENDVRNVSSIIRELDKKWKVWHTDSINTSSDKVDKQSFVDILDKSLDTNVPKPSAFKSTCADEKLLKVLDKLILYLRIVHSVDYYGTVQYNSEDEMPHRCGIFHVRNAWPSSPVTEQDVFEWKINFDEKIKPLMNCAGTVSEEDMLNFGKKNSEQEVEKFITANTQEITKDKWLCPLSGKKFKGPEFVRKHIMTKHQDKVNEVLQEVEYFNNYLSDPKRPQFQASQQVKRVERGEPGMYPPPGPHYRPLVPPPVLYQTPPGAPGW